MESRGRPGEGLEARLSSKKEAEIRRPGVQKAERKAAISPSFSKASSQALAGCVPPNGSTAWRAGVDRGWALRLGFVARGRPRLGVPEGRKRRGKL